MKPKTDVFRAKTKMEKLPLKLEERERRMEGNL